MAVDVATISFTPCSSGRANAKHARGNVLERRKPQRRAAAVHGLIGVVICVRQVTCFEQGLPSEATRRRTAQHILDIMSSRSQGSRGQGQVKLNIWQGSFSRSHSRIRHRHSCVFSNSLTMPSHLSLDAAHSMSRGDTACPQWFLKVACKLQPHRLMSMHMRRSTASEQPCMNLRRLEWTSRHGAAWQGLWSHQAPLAYAAFWAGSCIRSLTFPARKASALRGATSARLSPDCKAVLWS